ncbi:MAG TPA: DUF1839 family protein [Ramlibacter sp.]|nr:DUF1839 family protein [Ramlibacter sp.]
MSRQEVLPGLTAARYQRHPLHGGNAVWAEKNCYGDMWIELLHALKLEPLASLGYTLAVDFEGDQWTFFKPQLNELRDLYGIDVQELTVWRPLIEHAVEHLGAGRLISTEADAFWLPDTAGTDYREHHTKTTIALTNLDVTGGTLGYFHNAGYYELSGEDFRNLFRLDAPADPRSMPPFAELVHIDRLVRHPPADLAVLALRLLRRHLDWRPKTNPFVRFGDRFTLDLPQMREAGLERYHDWAFASVRQAGAAFELAAAHLRWHAGFGMSGLRPSAELFDAIAQGNKALILKAARAVNSGRPLDAGALFAEMAQAWDRGMVLLQDGLEEHARAANPAVS